MVHIEIVNENRINLHFYQTILCTITVYCSNSTLTVCALIYTLLLYRARVWPDAVLYSMGISAASQGLEY